jgi:hypothetical protein
VHRGFPDATWELRLELARQCWDESRHARMLLNRVREMGGDKGEFPVMHFEWNITCMVDSLAARLAIQNRTFEGGEMDVLKVHADLWRDEGDQVTAELLEGILSDEVQHVRFGQPMAEAPRQGRPAHPLHVAQGIAFMKRVTAATRPSRARSTPRGGDLRDLASQPHQRRRSPPRGILREGDRRLLRRDGFGALVS